VIEYHSTSRRYVVPVNASSLLREWESMLDPLGALREGAEHLLSTDPWLIEEDGMNEIPDHFFSGGPYLDVAVAPDQQGSKAMSSGTDQN
jgi:hypothetical protein